MTKVLSVRQFLENDNHIDEETILQGWVKTKRDSKSGLSFLTIQDGTFAKPVQIIAQSSLENYDNEILRLTSGCSIRARGIKVASLGKGQAYEMQAQKIEVLGYVENPETYPIQAKKHSMEFLREVAHLRARTNIIAAVTRVRHVLSQAIHQFFHEQGFYWIHTPIITSSDCEGAGEMFRVSTLDLMNLPKTPENKIDFSKDFFGKETFLTVSGQLNVEAYCLAMSKVYTFGPTFRAENSNTSRHLAEFWMVEPEIAFADLNDLCTLSQNLLQYLCKKVLNDCAQDLQFFEEFVFKDCLARLTNLEKSNFEILNYTDAINILLKSKQKFIYPVEWGLDLQSEHERYLAEEYFQSPVIIINYPKEIKGFYMRLNDDGKTVAAMDVLAPGIGEIIGGSQREERLDILDKRIIECGLPVEQYNWYRDLRKYGTVPHAGFGLGLERLVGYMTGVANIRDLIPFPRTPGNAEF